MRHPVHGDIFPMTWMPDDRQFVSFSDGFGLGNESNHCNTAGLWISGAPADAKFQKISGYPTIYNLDDPAFWARYYGFGALAVGNRLYQSLSMAFWIGTRLIYSEDGGRTWRNQDGSTPVIWERRDERSKCNMLFFEESQNSFSLLTFLQAGKNYEHNRDGYAYGYAPNGNLDGQMNELVMLRVPRDRILSRHAYEFFAGLDSDGRARWSADIDGRKPVHVFPRGWVNKAPPGGLVVQSWVPSVAYNAPLGLYVMVASGAAPGPEGQLFAKPSYFGVWVADTPWGPWNQVAEESAWTPENDSAADCYSPQIAPKWIAPDGKSFWLVWSDFRSTCSPEERTHLQDEQRKIKEPRERVKFQLDVERRCAPHYVFNTQRVDLVVT